MYSFYIKPYINISLSFIWAKRHFFQVDPFLLKEEKLCFLRVSGGLHRSTESSVMHVTRGDLHVGQMFSRHLFSLYPPTGTLSEKASACLSTPNPAVPFQAKVTTTVPNCLEGSCDAGHPPTMEGSRQGRRIFITFYDVSGCSSSFYLLWCSSVSCMLVSLISIIYWMFYLKMEILKPVVWLGRQLPFKPPWYSNHLLFMGWVICLGWIKEAMLEQKKLNCLSMIIKEPLLWGDAYWVRGSKHMELALALLMMRPFHKCAIDMNRI